MIYMVIPNLPAYFMSAGSQVWSLSFWRPDLQNSQSGQPLSIIGDGIVFAKNICMSCSTTARLSSEIDVHDKLCRHYSSACVLADKQELQLHMHSELPSCRNCICFLHPHRIVRHCIQCKDLNQKRQCKPDLAQRPCTHKKASATSHVVESNSV